MDISCVRVLQRGAALVVVVFTFSTSQALTIDYVSIGNPGNANDDTGYGSVFDVYAIGTHEVTAGQYTEFLNGVADTDPYGLYSSEMWTSPYGCKIERNGSSGSYTYSVAPDRANRPVVYVSFWDAVRFANWLHNGQGEGDTETGAYTVAGYTGPDGSWITRNSQARVWIPSENEWYKAAYHKNDGITGNYWEYPTQGETAPTAELPPGTDITNGSANYRPGGFHVDPLYHTTEAGAYSSKPSNSAYGTFDQGGNVWEWNYNTMNNTYNRIIRGGSFDNSDFDLRPYASSLNPTDDGGVVGFRVATISALGLLLGDMDFDEDIDIR